MTHDFEHQTEISNLEAKNSLVRLEDKLSFLKEELEKSNHNADLLQEKLDKAYSEIRDLASKTVESAGRMKIISTTEKSEVR